MPCHRPGLRPGTPLATVQQCLQQALALAGGTLADVAVLASIEAKADEAAFCNWPHSMAGLCTGTAPRNWRLCPCPTLGHRAALHGHPSVSEAAALLAAQADLSALVVEKHKLRGPDGKNATVSIARMAAASSTPFHPRPFLERKPPMHIEIGIISPKSWPTQASRPRPFRCSHHGPAQSPTAWLRTALAAFFFSVLMQAWHLPVGPSELHLVGPCRCTCCSASSPRCLALAWACWCKPWCLSRKTWPTWPSTS